MQLHNTNDQAISKITTTLAYWNKIWRQLHTQFSTYSSFSNSVIVVEPPAVLPDLPLWPGQWHDVAHVHHWLCKVLEEEMHIIRIRLHECRCFRALGKQDLVGAEETPAGKDVLEVEVVKLGRADDVEWEEIVVAARAGAPLS